MVISYFCKFIYGNRVYAQAHAIFEFIGLSYQFLHWLGSSKIFDPIVSPYVFDMEYAFKNILVDPTDESYRGALKPRGYNWMEKHGDSHKHWH